ncbi:MAG: efflux RND transporter periplasmic adaptor subunit [Balneolaceae bacterium]|nr:MAG: efflux RND transporter periplasmic adaptor subunit [Balneolaceae bacterium]
MNRPLFPMRKRMITIITGIMLTAITGCGESPELPASEPVVSVTVAGSETRDLTDEFAVSSEVVAYRRVYIASRLSALVEEVNAEEGVFVREGDVLARLDVRQQQSDLSRAAVLLEESRDNYDRTRRLYEQGAVSEAEYLTVKRLYEQRRAEAERLELVIEFGTIHAPMNGIITARLVEVGNSVSVNERMFTLADMDLLVVRPAVSEMNLRGISEGDEVRVTLDVYPDQLFTGKVRRIFPAADPLTRLFTVEAELMLKESDPVIRTGYLARTLFTADARREVITVPSEAVYRQNETTTVFLLNEDQNRVIKRTVATGVQRDGYVEIISGLQAGEVVAAANLESLRDGTPVRVVGTLRRTGFRN